MANIGEQLLQPESGWQRIDDNNINIVYIGNDWTIGNGVHYIRQGVSTSVIDNSAIVIYAKTDKIRIL